MHTVRFFAPIGVVFFTTVVGSSALAAELSIETIESSITLTDEQKASIKKAAEEKEREKDNAILNKYFGAGIMANVDFGPSKSRRVKSARTVGGLVRVEDESKAQIGFLLEAHKFVSDAPTAQSRSVYGPFVGVVLNGDGGIDTGILGFMWGFRQPSTTQTLNIGLGLSITPSAQVLGDGIKEGEALPAGETEVRYKNTTKYGFAVTVSFGF